MARLPDNFADRAAERFSESHEAFFNYRADVRDDYAFVAGKQWMPEDEAYLQEQKRPPVTFNYSEKMIDAVVGAEVSSRQEVRYAPRGVEDAAAAELLTNAAKWVRDLCNAEDEESDAFRDALICGLGWTETRMDYTVEADGKIIIERVDPLEMYYDPAANRVGLTDSRYVWREWWVNKTDAQRAWPDAQFPELEPDDMSTGVIRHGDRYESEYEREAELHKDQVRIRHYQTYENEPYYRIVDGDRLLDVPEDDFKRLKSKFDELGVQYVKQFKRVYYRAFFAGDSFLEGGLSPCQEGFTFKAVTGKRDRNKNTWYGITKVMKDPQRWANKWLSQIMHIINSNAKGGLLAESGAFADPRKAQDEWAQPDSITMLNEGGINKIQQKAMTPYPSGLDRLMDFALGSLPMVTGINLEVLGLASREQAGVLESQRKQAAYGILAPYFDSLRLYRKEQGRILLYFIRNYISDGRMIRIVGPQGEQHLPLTKVPDLHTYDIIVDQSPNAPDTKQKTWETLIQILPSMLKAGVPIPPDLISYTPLPVTLAQKWQQYINERQGAPTPQQMQQMQQQMQQMQQENQKLQMSMRDKSAELQLKQQQAQAEFQLKVQELEQELAIERAKMTGELELKNMELANSSLLETRRIESDIANKRAQAEGNMKLKVIEKGLTEGGPLDLKLDTAEFDDTLKSVMESQAQAMAMFERSQQQLAQALTQIATLLASPKVLIYDEQGRPVGVRPTLQ